MAEEPPRGGYAIKYVYVCKLSFFAEIGPLQDPVTWYGMNYAGTQMAQWDFQNKGKSAGLVRVPLFWKSHCVICVPA